MPVSLSNIKLAELMQSKQALQASSLVGHSVFIPGDKAFLTNDGQFKGSLELPSPGKNVQISLINQQGVRVKQIDLGIQPSGSVHFSWDGQLDDGNKAQPGLYTIKAQANINGQPMSLATQISANVNSVSLAKGGKCLQLNLAGIGPVNFNQVTLIN